MFPGFLAGFSLVYTILVREPKEPVDSYYNPKKRFQVHILNPPSEHMLGIQDRQADVPGPGDTHRRTKAQGNLRPVPAEDFGSWSQYTVEKLAKGLTWRSSG